MTVDEIGSRLEIQHILTLYCRGVDFGDGEMIKKAFHSDATDEHGPFHNGTGWELAERLNQKPGHSDAHGHHHVVNVFIEFDSPDSARVESYVMAHHPTRGGPEPDQTLMFAGRYL